MIYSKLTEKQWERYVESMMKKIEESQGSERDVIVKEFIENHSARYGRETYDDKGKSGH